MAKPLLSLTKKDFTVTYFSGTGAGGQHRNKHMNCVRIKHTESGACATGTEQRSRSQNKQTAFRRLCSDKKFLTWLRIESLHKGQLLETVSRLMEPDNLKVEVFTAGKWEEE
jgi:hypothetical protein